MSTIHSIDRYAVIGHPISHSLSPVIHAAFAAQTEQHLTYEAIDVVPAQLETVLMQLPATGYRGISITVPHKEAAWAYTQHTGQLTERARLAGAINTLAWRTDGVLGDNTDGQGLLNDLQQRHQLDLTGQRILLLGAGGAARGVILPLLAAKPAALVIANRTADKAETLAALFAPHAAATGLAGCGLDALGTHDHHDFDLVINATSASLGGEAVTLPTGTLSADAFAYDMMYGKTLTPFLAAQQQSGIIRLADGLGMLVEQAAVAFALWRGVTPDTGPVYHALRERLARH
jgi:shikimate dehydrogenase